MFKGVNVSICPSLCCANQNKWNLCIWKMTPNEPRYITNKKNCFGCSTSRIRQYQFLLFMVVCLAFRMPIESTVGLI